MAAPATKGEADLSAKTVYYLGVLRTSPDKPAVELVADTDLSSFSRFTRNSFLEGLKFTSKAVAENTKVGTRDAGEAEGKSLVGVYHTSFGFCVVMIAELTYHPGTAKAFVGKVADAFKSQFTPTEIREKTPPFEWAQIAALRKEAITAAGSGIAAVQKELDETMVVMHKTIDSVLQRGETLDSLVAKSDELSYMSKGFYKQAKQQNSCCVVM